MYSAHFGKSAATEATSPAKPVSSIADRAKQLAKPFAGDAELEAWTARMLADSESYLTRKRPDPLGGFLK